MRESDCFLVAVRSLKRIGRLAVPALIESLQHRDALIRSEAATALGEIRDASAVSSLNEALKDENEGVRRAASEALAKF